MSDVKELIKNLNLKIKQDKLLLPTLPRVAMKVREACDDYDTSVESMVSILSQDPALSARMIKYANSAIVKRNSKQNIDNLNQVVTRIGLINIKNIATAIAMEQLFISTHKIIHDYMTKSWNKTINIACFSSALLKIYLEDNPRCRLNLDTMTLMGLMYNIGMLPILTEAEANEGDFLKENVLNYCIDKFSSDIGTKIVTEWGFGDEFVSVIKNWSNTSFKTKEPSYLDFIRIALLYNDQFDSTVDKEALYDEFKEKGIFEDISLFTSDFFKKTVSDVGSAFY
jgi:HD-like signal output (HDOD) protein